MPLPGNNPCGLPVPLAAAAVARYPGQDDAKGDDTADDKCEIQCFAVGHANILLFEPESFMACGAGRRLDLGQGGAGKGMNVAVPYD